MRFRDQEVWLAYDGVRAPELAPSIPDIHSPNNVAKVHVMSEIDKLFSINWRHLAPKTLLSISIRMDGRLIHQHVSLPTSDSGQLCGIVSGPKSVRPFVFVNIPRLKPEDIELAKANPVIVPNLGTIRVTIVPVQCVLGTPTAVAVGGLLCGNVSPSPQSDIHRISLDRERPLVSKGPGGQSPAIPIMPPFDMQLMNDKGVIFEFHYGPLVCLQALGIVPARTVVAEDGQTNALPLTPSTTMLGKRSRLQYEDILSLSETDANSSASETVKKPFITGRLAKEEGVENVINV